jgi:hypothetical protein
MKVNGGASSESSALIAARESLKLTIADFINAKLSDGDAKVAIQALRCAISMSRDEFYVLVEQVGHWEVERLLLKYWLLTNEGRDTV